MNSRIFVGLSKEEIEEARRILPPFLSDPALELVRNAIRRMELKLKFDDFETPSWSHKQAYCNGYNAALEEVLKVIEQKG